MDGPPTTTVPSLRPAASSCSQLAALADAAGLAGADAAGFVSPEAAGLAEAALAAAGAAEAGFTDAALAGTAEGAAAWPQPTSSSTTTRKAHFWIDFPGFMSLFPARMRTE